MKLIISALLLGLLLIGSWQPALATLKDDIGYTRLLNEMGANAPTGAGIKVALVEANVNTTGLIAYRPDPAGSEFTGKTITAKSGSTPVSLYPYSSHATGVARLFYGNNTSIAPGITSIDNYLANSWEEGGYLGFRYSGQPAKSRTRVANHSYVGTYGSNLSDSQILRRMDWLVNRDEYIQVVGMNNGSYNKALWGSAFNAIAVGLSNGGHATGAVNLSSAPYGAGRTRPDLVVPQTATSYATPVVSSAAALLVETGHKNPALSRDPIVNSTQNRLGDTIYNAERSEVVKAALMAGASRTAAQLTKGYTVNTANGLNSTYGAGQLNIFDSYHIIAAGEQNSREDYQAGGGEIMATGFDYDPTFGGLQGSNRTGTYVFKALTTGSLAASLVWNLAVNGGTSSNFDGAASLYNLFLSLYDMTSASEIAHADSIVDNAENIWWTSLTPNHSYMLKVTAGQTDFLWDYGLAWNISATTTHAPVPATAVLLATGLVGLIGLRRKFKG
jgi:hypothetical protein